MPVAMRGDVLVGSPSISTTSAKCGASDSIVLLGKSLRFAETLVGAVERQVP